MFIYANTIGLYKNYWCFFVGGRRTQSIEWFIEDHAFSQTYDLASCPSPHLSSVSMLDQRYTRRLRKRDNFQSWDEGRGKVRSQIVRPQESLILYKSFNTPWVPGWGESQGATCFSEFFVSARSNWHRSWPYGLEFGGGGGNFSLSNSDEDKLRNPLCTSAWAEKSHKIINFKKYQQTKLIKDILVLAWRDAWPAL